MRRTKIQINELRLRSSGLTRDQARRLGVLVATRLAESGADTNGTIPQLNVHVTQGAGKSVVEIADVIAVRVRRSISSR